MGRMSRRCKGEEKRPDTKYGSTQIRIIICTCHYKSCRCKCCASSKSYTQSAFQHLYMFIEPLIGGISQSHISLFTTPKLFHQSHSPYLLPLHLVTYRETGTSLCLQPQTCSRFLTILSSRPLYFAALSKNSSVCDISFVLKADVGLRNEERRWDCSVKRAGFA
jgi:hypothetical protein